MAKAFWDQRYAEDGFVYGPHPNLFFCKELGKLKPGRLLLPGEGEGRNAVYAARRGWEVVAFDQSSEGQRKALALAAQKVASHKVCKLGKKLFWNFFGPFLRPKKNYGNNFSRVNFTQSKL